MDKPHFMLHRAEFYFRS